MTDNDTAIIITISIILAVLVVYVIIMVGLMASQTKTADAKKAEINGKRVIVKTKYNVV